jgi:hypothetical protein
LCLPRKLYDAENYKSKHTIDVEYFFAQKTSLLSR